MVVAPLQKPSARQFFRWGHLTRSAFVFSIAMLSPKLASSLHFPFGINYYFIFGSLLIAGLEVRALFDSFRGLFCFGSGNRLARLGGSKRVTMAAGEALLQCTTPTAHMADHRFRAAW